MSYILKHKDISLIEFDVIKNIADPVVEICRINENQRRLLPLDLDATNEGLAKWLKTRTIPKNRAFVNAFLSKCGLNINRPMDVIYTSKGLSLNDVFWVVDSDFKGAFEDYNLYTNRFSRILAFIAFTGIGSSVRSSLASSPEFTTNGMLKKCWRRDDGTIFLYKGASYGASNTGYEPYSEFYASEIARTIGINAVPYTLKKWKGELCSVCENFTSLKYSFIPAGRLVKSGGMQAVRELYQQLGPEFISALNEMIVFDAIICNTDRHFGNFGVLVDNDSNRIVKPAPLFDHGNSLFSLIGLDDLETEETFQSYVNTLQPRVYDDFIEEARVVMTEENRAQLRKLLNYRLKKHTRYNVPEQRYRLINKQIQKRAGLLLG